MLFCELFQLFGFPFDLHFEFFVLLKEKVRLLGVGLSGTMAIGLKVGLAVWLAIGLLVGLAVELCLLELLVWWIVLV